MKRNIYQPPQIKTDDFASLSPHLKINRVLEFAVLAPSTHNTQPWKFKIDGDVCQVLIDNSRQLPAADKLRRDMYISLGALLKNLEIAAKAFGIFDYLEISDQTSDLVAEIHFKNLDGGKLNAEFKQQLLAITTRTNYRGPFKPLKIDQKIQALTTSSDKQVKAMLIKDREQLLKIGELTAEGLRMGYATPAFRKEISSWIKANTSRSKKGIPGYSLRMPMLVSHIIPKVMRFKDLGVKLADLNYKSFVQASAVVVLTTEKEDPKTWLAVGQVAQQIFLNVETAGYVYSVFVASIEIKPLNPRLKTLAGLAKNEQPQFLFCLGAPVLPKVYSPRESVKSKLSS